jgi:hypothetical protein
MDHKKFQEMLVNDGSPAIQEKQPRGEWDNPHFHIKIQQDNVGGHSKVNDSCWIAALEELERIGNFTCGKISFYAQPPNSPYLYILDVGLFAALQASYCNESPGTGLKPLRWCRRSPRNIQPTGSKGSL